MNEEGRDIQVRTWRVGTISMGASLLFLGIFLLLSQFIGLSLSHIMISWWPIILVVLGLEILVYLFLSRTEKPHLKYDFLSIFFVGIIGMVGIGFAVLSSTGLLDFIDKNLTREERTLELPELTTKIDGKIKRVVLNAEHYPISIEGTPSDEVSAFGTYTATLGKGETLVSKVEDYISVYEKGDTLFLNVKRLPQETGGFVNFYANLDATILVPDNVKLEIVGQDNPVTLKPREMKSNWIVENVSEVSIFLEKDSDVDISAVRVGELISQNGEWTITSKDSTNEEYYEEQQSKSGSFKLGEGTHSINIVRAYQVSLSMLN